MSASVDIHAQLASILERFAKCALLEMSRAVEQEMTRRQMETETLLVKLQFTESELRSARQSQAYPRSVGTQVNNSGQRVSPALCPLGPEVEDQDSFSAGTTGPAREGRSKIKPSGLWNSPVSEEYPINSEGQSLDASPLESGERYENRRPDLNTQHP
ncbi:hypothetical protein cypCar_00047636, partial [Cyprinus carpio]